MCVSLSCALQSPLENDAKRQKSCSLPKAIVLDIEGTTTPLSFTKDVLFPYARANVRQYLKDHFRNSQVISTVSRLSELLATDKYSRSEEILQNLIIPDYKDNMSSEGRQGKSTRMRVWNSRLSNTSLKDWFSSSSSSFLATCLWTHIAWIIAEIETTVGQVVSYVEYLMDSDRKAEPLKTLQVLSIKWLAVPNSIIDQTDAVLVVDWFMCFFCCCCWIVSRDMFGRRDTKAASWKATSLQMCPKRSRGGSKMESRSIFIALGAGKRSACCSSIRPLVIWRRLWVDILTQPLEISRAWTATKASSCRYEQDF